MVASVLVSIAALVSGPVTPAQAPVVRIAPGVQLQRGAFMPGRQPDGNSVLFEGPRGVVVVDTGRHAAHTQAVIAAVRATGKPPQAIVSTHWHLDHVSGNPAMREVWLKARVYASSAIGPALEGFLAHYRRDLLTMLADPGTDAATKAGVEEEIARIDAGPALLPDVPVDRARVLRAAGLRLELHVAHHAATAADVWLFDPRSRVLAPGDLVTLPVPFLDTACPSGWRAALAELDATDFELMVPGHGGALDHTQFRMWRAAFDALLDCAAGDADIAACSSA
jgi:glyoxylase-like metal-dependent hydrolase (beta-lactamase superfamily II)